MFFQCFAYLYRILYGCLLQPDDDSFTRCRKAVLTIYFVFGIINIITNTAAIVTARERPILALTNNVFYYVASVIWIVSWLYAKFTRTSPDWLVNLVMDVSLCLLVISTFSSPNWG